MRTRTRAGLSSWGKRLCVGSRGRVMRATRRLADALTTSSSALGRDGCYDRHVVPSPPNLGAQSANHERELLCDHRAVVGLERSQIAPLLQACVRSR
jgi:hypothetical protein